MTLWIIIKKWIKKYVFLYLFSGTLPYRGEMRLCVIYPIPLSMQPPNSVVFMSQMCWCYQIVFFFW